MISMSPARSSTVLAIPPGLSKVGEIKNVPSGGIVCGVHLSAKSAALLAGVLMEPSVSLANASGL